MPEVDCFVLFSLHMTVSAEIPHRELGSFRFLVEAIHEIPSKGTKVP